MKNLHSPICFILLLISTSVPASLNAQDCRDKEKFNKAMLQADSSIRMGNYALAQDFYNAAKVYCLNKSDMVEKAKDDLFLHINNLKKLADSISERSRMLSLTNEARVQAFIYKDFVHALKTGKNITREAPKMSDLAEQLLNDLSTDTLLYSQSANVLYDKHYKTPHINHSVALCVPKKWMAFIGTDSTIYIQNYTNGDTIQRFHYSGAQIFGISFSDDGKYLALGGSDGMVKVIHTETLQTVWQKMYGEMILQLKFFHTKPWLAIGTQNGDFEFCNFLKDTVAIQKYKDHSMGIRASDISPDDRYLVTGGWDGMIYLYDLNQKGKVKYDLTKPENDKNAAPLEIYDACFSRNTKELITCGSDGKTCLWDTETRTLLSTFSTDKEPTWSCAFSTDNRYVVTGSDYGVTRLWDKNSGQVIEEFVAEASIVYTTEFISADNILTVNGSGSVKIWKTRPRKNIIVFSGKNGAIAKIHFQAPSIVELIYYNGKRAVWNIDNAALLHLENLYDTHDSSSVARMVHAKSYKNAMFLYAGVNFSNINRNLKNFVVFNHRDSWGKVFEHKREVLGLDISKDERYILTCSWDMTAAVWDLQTERQLMKFIGHEDGVACGAISTDNKYVATGGLDRTIRLWEIASGKLIQTIKCPDKATAIQISDNNGRIVSGHQNGELRIWDTINSILEKVSK